MGQSNADKIKAMVLKVLDNPITTHQIAFRIGSVYIGPSYYSRVRDAVAADEIGMRKQGSAKKASYNPTKNRLTVGFTNADGNADREALILQQHFHALAGSRLEPVGHLVHAVQEQSQPTQDADNNAEDVE